MSTPTITPEEAEELKAFCPCQACYNYKRLWYISWIPCVTFLLGCGGCMGCMHCEMEYSNPAFVTIARRKRAEANQVNKKKM